MNDGKVNDPVLSRFCQAVVQEFGAAVERVVLYGSRARGEGRADSDYDVAVFLEGLEDRGEAITRLADIGTIILYDVGSVIHAMPYQARSYEHRTPLMHEIRRDGIDL